MTRRTVDSVASAVVRRLQPPARGLKPVSALIASIAAPRVRRPGPVAAFASVAARPIATPRRGRTPPAAQPIDILANKLASAVTRRLAGGPAAKPGIPLAASRLTTGIVRKVGKQLGRSPRFEPVSLSAIDPAALANALAGTLGTHQAAQTDPAAIVASTILRRLRTVRFVGTPADARAFQDRVASIVTESLRAAATDGPAAGAEHATAAPGPADEPGAAATATARKRD